MVVEMVPLKGGIGSIFHPPKGKDYKWYVSGIFPANWGMDYATYLPPFRGTRNNHWFNQPPKCHSTDSTLPETNMTARTCQVALPQKETRKSSNHPFSGATLR